MEHIRNTIEKVLNQQGVEIGVDNQIEMDSIQYISVIVQLEDHFDITFPDEYLINSTFVTVNNIENAISILISEKNESE